MHCNMSYKCFHSKMVQAETGSSPLLVTGSGSTRADIKKNIKLLADILKPRLKPCFYNIPHQTLSTEGKQHGLAVIAEACYFKGRRFESPSRLLHLFFFLLSFVAMMHVLVCARSDYGEPTAGCGRRRGTASGEPRRERRRGRGMKAGAARKTT